MLDWIANNLPLFLLLAGGALVIAEAFVPGAHFIVLGVALFVAGLVGLALPGGMGVLGPLILAALVLGAGAITLYLYRQFDFYGGKGGEQTSDSDSLRGETGRVTERVTPTSGEVKLEDAGFNPFYRARSVDGEISEETEVMVVDPGGGNIVTVESVAGGYDEIDRELARARKDGDDKTPTDGSDDVSLDDLEDEVMGDGSDGGAGDGSDEGSGDGTEPGSENAGTADDADADDPVADPNHEFETDAA